MGVVVALVVATELGPTMKAEAIRPNPARILTISVVVMFNSGIQTWKEFRHTKNQGTLGLCIYSSISDALSQEESLIFGPMI